MATRKAVLIVVSMIALTACSEKEKIKAWRIGLTSLQTAANAKIAVVASLQADGEITAEEAEQFSRFVETIPVACVMAIAELDTDKPYAQKVLGIAKIIASTQRRAVLDLQNPKARAAYLAVVVALDTLAAQVNLAASKAAS